MRILNIDRNIKVMTGYGEGHGDGEGGTSGRRAQLKGRSDRVTIPALPMPTAIICCVLNFLIPGLGKLVTNLLQSYNISKRVQYVVFETNLSLSRYVTALACCLFFKN